MPSIDSGGSAVDFNPLMLEEQIFRLSVFSKQVGFMILESSVFTCEFFKLGFFLCNDLGFQKALRFAKSDSGPSFSWELAGSKKNKMSYAEAVNSHVSPLSGANLIPLGKNKAHFSSSSQGNTHSFTNKSGSVFSRLVFPRRSVFSRLNFQKSSKLTQRTGVQQASSSSGPFGQAFAQPDTIAPLDIYCRRCLSSNHSMECCKNRVKCWHCRQWGHVLKSCSNYRDLQRFIQLAGRNPSNNFSPAVSTANWPLNSWLTWFKGKHPMQDGPEVIGPPHPSSQGVSSHPSGVFSFNKEAAPSAPSLPLPTCSSSSPATVALDDEGSQGANQAPSHSDMAFLNIDPEPMMLAGFARVLVEGRPKYSRVVTRGSLPVNEDLAIVTISNLPQGEIPFNQVRNAILGLLEEDYDLRIAEVQRSPFARGQAYIRFTRVSDRDSLVLHSPHHFQGLEFVFVNHNRGANVRRVLFNRECWLMLIGFPPDNRSMDDIKDIIKPFARLICWQRDDVLARIFIKVRVTELSDIPHYIIMSEGDDHEGISFTIQCEIVQQNMLGVQLQDEDIPPGGFEDGEFVFPGFEQDHQLLGLEHNHPDLQNENQPPPLLPDLNENILDGDQLWVDQPPQELGPVGQEQVELDLHLSLSQVPSGLSSTGSVIHTVNSVQGTNFSNVDGNPDVLMADIVLGIPAPFAPLAEGNPVEEAQPPNSQNDMAIQLENHPLPHGEVGPAGIPQLANQGMLVVNQMAQEAFKEVDQPGLPDLLPVAPAHGNNSQMGPFNMHLNINMAYTHFNTPKEGDALWARYSGVLGRNPKAKPLPDVFCLWAKHFSPVGCQDGVVKIPVDWAAFFVTMLLSSTHFEWARSFLSSPTWKFLLGCSCSNSDELMTFALPEKCPGNSRIQCIALADAPEALMNLLSYSRLKIQKSKLFLPSRLKAKAQVQW